MHLISKNFKRLLNFKGFWSKLTSKQKKILYILLIIVLLILFYCLWAISAVSQAEVNLLRLKDDLKTRVICHDSCLLFRKELEQEIIRELQSKNSTSLKKIIADYYVNSNESLEYKSELINVLSLAFGVDNPPDYLKKYILSFNVSAELKAHILDSFSLVGLMVNDSAELKTIDRYFLLLEGKNDWSLQEAAVRAISNFPEKELNFSESQLLVINNIIINPKTSVRLRTALILLLSDYYPFFPERTRLILEVAYKSLVSDAVSKYMAADILNRVNLDSINFPLPVVSEIEWQEYNNY